MKFEILMNDAVIHQAAALVRGHCKDSGFFVMLMNEKYFNHTNDDGREVAVKIYDNNLSVKIIPYKTFSPWSNVIGYASGDTIYVNTRKINLPLKDRVQNFMHEPLHLLGYSHKGNKVNAYNLETVPYKVSAIFVKYLESIGKL